MSATLKNLYASVPQTTRGKSVLLGGDPKKQQFLYCSGSSVFMRNIQDPLKCETYVEHAHQTTVARYAPSGFYCASGDVGGNVRIWDTINKEHILKIELRVLSGAITDIQWSDDSKRLIAVGEGKDKFGAVFMFDSGSSVGEISGHSKNLSTCDFKQTRPYRVVTGGEDFLVNFFEGPPFKYKKSIKDHTRFVNCIRFSPDGNKFISVGSDFQGFIYDAKDGGQIGQLSATNAHTAGIYGVSWSPDSKQVLTASADKTCKIWNVETGECVKTFNFSDNPQLEHQQLGCLWQGEDLLSVGLSGDIYYLDINNPNQPKRVLRGHNKNVTALTFDATTGHLYSGSYDSLIIKWDVATGNTEPMVGKGHTNQINRLLVQGKNLVSCSMDDSVRITPLGSRQYGEAIALDSNPVDIAVGHKNLSLVIAVVTDTIVVIQDGKIVNRHKVDYQPNAVAIAVGDNQISVAGKDNLIRTYELSGTSLKPGVVIKGPKAPVNRLTYSPDGKYLASADQGREVYVFDAHSGEVKITGWIFHNARVNDVAWTPDSLHLASGSLDGSVIIWSVEKTDKRIILKDCHRGGVTNVVWLDNNTVASTGQDGTIRSWAVTHY